MAQAFLHGSGFDPLNFKVVGGAAAPSNPRENTIWVTSPNLLDFKTWAANTAVSFGTKTYTDTSITITASRDDCYTDYTSTAPHAKIPVAPGKTYVLSWEYSGADGWVYLFPDAGSDGAVRSYTTSKKLEITIAEGISFVTFRVGVATAGGVATYSDITFREKPADITGWHLGAEEPNIWDVTTGGDSYSLQVPIKLSEGDILNFTIPASVSSIYEAIRIQDAAGKLYFVRSSGGAAITGWNATVKVGLVISNKSYPIGSWGSQGGTAHLYKWNGYYHKEGTLWIVTGAASSAAFNALKRNDLRVYPVSAKQYVNGAWKDQEARICQRSRWKDWEFFVLRKGVFNSTYLFQVHNGDGEIASGDNAAIFKIHNNGYLTLYAVTKLDVSKKNAIEIAVTKGLSAYNVRFGLVSTKTSIDEQHENIFNVASVTFTPTSNSITPGRKTIDVSALSGEYWLGCTVEGSGGIDDSVYGKGGVSVVDIIIR